MGQARALLSPIGGADDKTIPPDGYYEETDLVRLLCTQVTETLEGRVLLVMCFVMTS